MKTNSKKQVVIGNPPKGFVGIAIAAATAAMSIASAVKKKKEAKKAATASESSALGQYSAQDQQTLEGYNTAGNDNVNYYQAGGGKVNARKRNTDPTEKDLTGKEVKEINKTTGVAFTNKGANDLFARNNVEDAKSTTPSVNFGKYKDLGYFELGNTEKDSGSVRVRNTKKNPHNGATIKDAMSYLREINPNKKLKLDFAYKAGGGNLKTGGSYDTMGGKLNKLSSDMEIAKGNTHESSKIDNTSGIKLIQGNKAVAEIEDDETMKDGNLVYSDRLKASNGKTFADNAEKLAKAKAKAEKRMGKGDSISKATAERKVGMLDLEEDLLFAEQEEYKKANGIDQNTKNIPKGNYGFSVDTLKAMSDIAGGAAGASGGGLAAVTPYIDNLVNAGLSLSMTPKVAKPSYLKSRKLNTDYNVNPQLNEVNQAVSGASKSIMENSSNSGVARNSVASVKLRGANQKAQILANKENRENQLENQNAHFQQRTDAVNAGKRDNYNMQNMARQAQIKNELSANMSNLAGDFADAENNRRDELYNTEALAAFKTAYDKNGIVGRSDDSMMKWIELMMKNKKAQGGLVKAK